jgi:hypothetical protein
VGRVESTPAARKKRQNNGIYERSTHCISAPPEPVRLKETANHE